jgi:probable phosphoglycerate mutase
MNDRYRATRFGLIRHAQTVWNRGKKIQGLRDSPLTAEGENQASGWGQILAQFSWDRILASDAGRALATAGIINTFLKIPLTTDSRLQEQNWGQWEGMTVRQIETDARQVLNEQINAGWDFCPPGGESRRSVLKRSRAALLDGARRYPAETILVVCHEGVVKSLIYDLYGRKFLPNEPPILKSYRLHRLVKGSSGLQIEHINALSLGS